MLDSKLRTDTVPSNYGKLERYNANNINNYCNKTQFLGKSDCLMNIPNKKSTFVSVILNAQSQS